MIDRKGSRSMQTFPFAQPGRSYKGDLHTHSNRSDGTMEPQQVIDIDRDAGYDFLSLSDRFPPREKFGKASVDFIDTTALDSNGFVTIPRAESMARCCPTPNHGISSASNCHSICRGAARRRSGPKAGSFYSSTGPDLHDVRIGGDELVVACSPVETILITSPGAKSQRKIDPGITAAWFPIAGWRELDYLGETVRDDAGG